MQLVFFTGEGSDTMFIKCTFKLCFYVPACPCVCERRRKEGRKGVVNQKKEKVEVINKEAKGCLNIL